MPPPSCGSGLAPEGLRARALARRQSSPRPGRRELDTPRQYGLAVVEPVAALSRSRRSALGLRRRGEHLRAGSPSVALDDRGEVVSPAGAGTGTGSSPGRASSGVRCLSATRPISTPSLPGPDRARQVLAACLEAVTGVGPVLAGQLRQDGITSLVELAQVLRFQVAAAEVLSEWEAEDLEAICWRLTRRLGERGHLLSTLVCSMVGIDQVAFFDLETMGLWNNPVFLAGVGRVRGGSLTVTQLLAPSFADEAEVIARTLEHLADAQVVVTFNGASADMPWLVNRAFYYGISPVPRFVHVDLVYGTRRRFGRGQGCLSDVRLPTVSQHVLARPRPAGDLPGWLIPEVYLHYSRRPAQREGLLVPILEHNQADLEALVELLQVLCHEAQACP